MRFRNFILAGATVVAAFAVAAPAGAQQAAAPQGGNAGGGIFDRLDTNHDGTIDASEFGAAASAAFAAADRMNDGHLTPRELRLALMNLLTRNQAANQGGNDNRGFDRERWFGRSRGDCGPRFRHHHHHYGWRDYDRYDRRDRDRWRDYDRRYNDDRRYDERRDQGPRSDRGPSGPPPQQQSPQGAPSSPAPGSTGQPATSAPQGGQGVSPSFSTIDRNGDGVITPDEFGSAFGLGR